MTKRLVLSLSIIFSPCCFSADSSNAPALQWFKTVSGSGTSSVATAQSDGHGNLFIAGSTTSLDFPTMAAAQPHAGSSPVTRINAGSGASQKIYSPVLAAATSIAADPSNPQTLYATATPTLLRSTDGGITWKALPGFPSVTNLDSVAVDPTNSNILYAATQPLGVLKSTDGGVTWAGANNGIPTFSQETTTVYGFPGSATGRDAYQIWADPESPGLLFVSTSTNALMRSTDGGASWSPVALRAQNWGKQVSDPFSKETIYAPASGSFYKSTDDGQTWTALAALPDASLTNAIAADPAHQGTLYGGSNTGLFQSTDSGKTWTRKIAGNTSLITSDPENGSMFAEVAGLGIVASTNGFTTYKSISPVSTFTQLAVAGSYLFAVAPPASDVFVTRLDQNGNIVYSTYFGGSGSDGAAAMALGNDGSVYVTGATNSADFPVTKGAYASSGASFVFKLNPDGSLAWSTYFTDNFSSPFAIAVDAAGNPYIGGQTSGDLPITTGAYETQFTPAGCPVGGIVICFLNDSAFLTKFNAQGSALVFSTYISHNQQQQNVQAANAIALAPNGNIYIAYNGINSPSPVPSAPGVYLMNATGSALIGSNTSEQGGINSIALGKDGNLYATGSTTGGFHATPGAFQSTPRPDGVGDNAFVLKFDGTLSKVLAATLLGGEGLDGGGSVALDASGNVIVGGFTDSKAFPARAPFQGSFSVRSGFVAGLDSSLSSLLFSTYLGSTPFIVHSAVPDGNGNLLVAGTTQTSNSAYLFDDAGFPYTIPSTVIVNKIALPQAPAVRLDSIVNYASRLGVALSPGEAIQAMGSGFGPDAKLLLDGNPLPLVFANSDLIVAVLPNDLQTSGSVRVTVSNGGSSSNPMSMPTAAASPGIYSTDNSGFGQGYILNADGTRNSQSNPATPGKPITILATGVGPVSNSGPYVITDQTVAVFIDGFYVSGIAAVMKPVAGLPGQVYEISVYAPNLAQLFKQNDPDDPTPTLPPQVSVTLYIGPAVSQQGIEVWLKPD